MRKRQNIVWLILALVLLALQLAACGGHEFRGATLEPPGPAPDFTLTDHNGQPFRLSEQRGKIVLLYFGFLSCPDICPTSMATLARAQRELGPAASDIVTALITVDPARDTAERMAQYTTGFDERFIGLRGDAATTAEVMAAYGVTAVKRELPDSAMGYTIDHSSFVYVIDQAGRLRLQYPHGSSAADVAADLNYLLRRGSS